jgi:hypothetical protein
MPLPGGVYGSATPTAMIRILALYVPSVVSTRTVAVRGLDATASRSRCTVADVHAGPFDEQREVGLHLRARREVRRAVHERRLDRTVSGSRRAGCSSRSARRCGCPPAGAWGLVHDSRRWKEGQRRNIPPGAGSPTRRRDRSPAVTANRRSGSPGSAADDDDRVVARRVTAGVSSAIGSRREGGAPGPGASAT